MKTNLQMTGTVQSGGTTTPQPLAGVSVTLYEATTDAPVTVGTATTDDDGKFSLDTSGTASDTIFYATARAAASNWRRSSARTSPLPSPSMS